MSYEPKCLNAKRIERGATFIEVSALPASLNAKRIERF